MRRKATIKEVEVRLVPRIQTGLVRKCHDHGVTPIPMAKCPCFLLIKTTYTGIQRCSKLTKHPKHSACKTSFIISKHRKWFESIHHPISSFLLPSNSSKNIQHVQSWAHCPPGFFVHLRIHGRSNADGLCACGDHLENGEFLKKHQCV